MTMHRFKLGHPTSAPRIDTPAPPNYIRSGWQKSTEP